MSALAISVSLAALVAVVPSATRAQSAPGLTAGYAFNEASGTSAADASGSGLTGALTNGATWGTGRNAGALLLDGVNDFVELGNPASLQLTGSMTVSAWVNSAAFPADDAAIVSKRASGEVGYQLDTTIDRGPRTIGFKLTNSSGGTMFRYGATTLQANTWYFVTGVYDAAAAALHVYLNGQLDDGTLLGTVTATQRNSTANVNIGRRPTGSTFNFNGRIDDVRIYGRALTPAEIQGDMSAPVAGVAGDTVAPSVAITSPAANAQVSGILNVSAIASDNVGVAGVQFLVDGANAGVEDTTSPYTLAWDSRTTANGAHTLTARARDAAGNSTLSAPVPVNVANASSFQNEILATGFNLPTSMVFLPDGRMLVSELPGTIKALSPPYTSVSPTPFLQLTNVGNDGYAGLQQGIFSVALDPNFATNRFFYVFYTTRTPNRDRLSRFTADASLTTTNLNTEVVLYQDPQDANTEHHGGGIAFGNDGKLYFTTGEHFQGSPAQDLTSPRGKIHRINLDGTVPTDNPFYDGNGPNVDSIWALGLRNPYRVYYDAPTSRLFVGDVGGNDASTAKEEVNLGAAAANYGWPNSEGACASPCKSPLYSYAHNGRDASITGGFVYHGAQFPSSYQGSYFFADYAQNWIKRLTFDASGDVNGVFNFEPLDGSPDGPYGDIVYLTEGPEGALYYIDLGYSDTSGTFGVSKLRRIRFSSGNQAPIAAGSATPSSGPAPLAVNFSSAGSSDPEGQALTYSWTFGDGGTSIAANPSHTYQQPGQYSARLSVSDGVNTTVSTPIAISAGSPPTATILTPTDGTLFRAGEVVSFSGDASDPDDGALPAGAFTWTIDFLHDGHVHPGAAQTGIKSGTFTIPTSGHDFSGNTRYRITLTVTDSSGLTSTRSVLILPRKVNLSFSTTPAGLTLYLDGIAKTTPFVYDTLIGFSHTVEARNQAAGGTSYTFGSWSDGGAQTHTIVVPATDQSYSATFQASAAPPAIAAYAFNETSGTSAADASGSGLTGTLTNGATWGAGRNAGALLLDGVDDFVELGNPARLQLTGSMTVSAWVNAAAFPVDDAAIVSKRGTSVGYQLDTTVDRGPRTVGFKLTNSSGGNMFRYGATTLQANTWYFVTGVYDAATSAVHVYLNGQLDDGTLVGAVTAAQQNSPANVNVGRRPGSNSFNLNGRIDDVRIYNRALTQAEVQADMNAPVGGSAGETTPPSVAITSPAANAQVSDIVNVTAIASDDVGVAGVQFLVDGVNAGVEDTAPPYGLAWDTRAVANGAHNLTARARDAAGNSTLSAPVPVNVANASSFQNEVLATGFNLPTNIEFLPDGRMLVVEFSGTIKVVPPPYVQPDPAPFLQLTNIAPPGSAVDRGVIDLALDPQFATNHYYYIFYTAETPTRDRLSRFTANAASTGTIAGSEVVLYQDTQDTTSASQSHHGGAIVFGNDGKLYFTTGDHFQGTPSQDLASPRGKLHRINPDGTVPTDNPFYDGNGPNVDSVWARGLRNPYRAYYDVPTGRLFIGDVGGNDNSTSQEEVDLAVRGANYGWPNVEGTSTNPAYTNPIYAYPHSGRDASITGGFVYHGTQFPSSYQGSYFFADYTQNWIKRLTFDASGNVNGVFNFEPIDGSVDGPYGDIVHLTEGPDGALYYVDIGYSDVGGTFGVSKLRRIRFVSGNQAPIAAGSATPSSGPAPLAVNFSSAGSSDPEGQALTYAWTFGDGGTSTAANPSHSYTQPGQYSARLSVSDGVNTTFSTPIAISVGSPPTATIVSPQDGAFFVAGDVISYSGNGTDPDDGTLPASAFTWTIDFLHEGHVHPGTPITGVKSGTFTIPTSGHDFSGNTRYRITLTVADSSGLTSTRSVLVFPRKVNLSFSSTPAGLTLYLDGVAKTTPFVYDTLTGFSHTVEARNQTSGGSSYTFGSWSDGGAQTHTIVVPATDQSYAASFQASAAPPAIAAWAFNDGSGTSAADASGGGLTGTLTNGATWGAGRNGGALLLDGVNDFVELGNPARLQLTGSMTVSAWVNSATFPRDDAAIVSKRTSSKIGYQLDTTIDRGPRTIGFKLTNSTGGNMFRYGATTLQPNTWYHVTGVYDAATSALHVYLNGQLDDGVLVGPVTATQQNSTANVNIGRRPAGSGSSNLNGRIDDVRIYSRALTPAEVQRDMSTPVG